MAKGNFYYRRLGNNIKTHRRKRRLSQEQLALLSGVDRSYLAEVEAGKANPSIRFLHKLSNALKIKTDCCLKNL